MILIESTSYHSDKCSLQCAALGKIETIDFTSSNKRVENYSVLCAKKVKTN